MKQASFNYRTSGGDNLRLIVEFEIDQEKKALRVYEIRPWAGGEPWSYTEKLRKQLVAALEGGEVSPL